MQELKPSSSVTYLHLSGPPAMPTARGTLDPGDLADNRADRTRSGGDHHGLASGGLADLKQPHVGRHTWHSEDAECGLNWCSRRIHLLEAGTVG